MASDTLPVLSHPSFPQVFAAAIEHTVAQLTLRQELGSCWFEDEHCDCHQLATVHHLGTDYSYCLRHFEAVSRG